jgi:hypothetical protein
MFKSLDPGSINNSLVGSSGVDACSLIATRNILRQALIDVDLADFPNEAGSSAVAVVVGNQIGAAAVVLTWN